MGNIWACTRLLKKMFCCGMAGSIEESETHRSGMAGSIERSETHMSGMGESIDVSAMIEWSKTHWSQLTEFRDEEGDESVEIENFRVFEAQQSHPLYGSFFLTFGFNSGIWPNSGTLEIGEKFAEGGQAELFHARMWWGDIKMQRAEIQRMIDHSKRHWSTVVKPYSKSKEDHVSTVEEEVEGVSDEEEAEAAAVSNLKEFRALQADPRWGTFFYTFNEGELVLGENFASGGQADIYEAEIKWRHPNWRELFLRKGEDEEVLGDPSQYVLKVFRKGTYLHQLKSNLPPSLLDFHTRRVSEWTKRRYICDVICGTLLEDGRFAFVLQREQSDLRSLIELKMKSKSENDGPFSKEVAENFMYEVALGMNWLHGLGLIHRDLKASNVLLREDKDWNCCFVADYECSIGTVGTGFHRAPEILEACKDRTISKRPELFTGAADVYSYGMTCYEILTGNLPFEGHNIWEHDLVLNGPPLQLPKHLDGWICDLLRMCWKSSPASRPTFKEILTILRENSTTVQSHIFTDVDMAHDKECWSQPKTEVLKISEMMRMYMVRKQRLQRRKSHLRKKAKSEHEKEMELEALREQRKQYCREDVLESHLESKWVLKVFKRGTPLRIFLPQLPHGVLKFHVERMEPPKAGTTPAWKKPKNVVNILCLTLLQDGRFGILMEKEDTDLRTLIDSHVRTSVPGCPPFSRDDAHKIMFKTALGVDWLHTHDIVHKDVKGSNVLVSTDKDGNLECFICDFEFGLGVVGTGFFRAPEILRAVKYGSLYETPEVFSKASDVYAYGMVCYEVLTGRLPFDGYLVRDHTDAILDGDRPEVPEYADDWERGLLERCWQANPGDRPSIGEILAMFETFNETTS